MTPRLSIALAAFAGALTWTLLEYVLHRFLGHGRHLRRSPFAVEHTRHHAEGNYFAPMWMKLIAAAVVAILVGLPAVLLGGTTGIAYTAGLIGFYGIYELLHRLEHLWPGIGPYARWARRHHFTHHFVDPKSNHGVTSPLWDLVFGTYRKPGPLPIAVPRKLRMPWLEDPATGTVRGDWAETFVLK